MLSGQIKGVCDREYVSSLNTDQQELISDLLDARQLPTKHSKSSLRQEIFISKGIHW